MASEPTYLHAKKNKLLKPRKSNTVQPAVEKKKARVPKSVVASTDAPVTTVDNSALLVAVPVAQIAAPEIVPPSEIEEYWSSYGSFLVNNGFKRTTNLTSPDEFRLWPTYLTRGNANVIHSITNPLQGQQNATLLQTVQAFGLKLPTPIGPWDLGKISQASPYLLQYSATTPIPLKFLEDQS